MVYNEETLISNVLSSLSRQKGDHFEISEIIVVATECTDRSVQIINEYIQKDDRIKLIEEDEKKGKIFSVLNFLDNASNSWCVVSSGDVYPDDSCFEVLFRELNNDVEVNKIGMFGPRVIPTFDANAGITQRINEELWNVHHAVSANSPKLGELVVVKKEFLKNIRSNVGCDEVLLEEAVIKNGRILRYYPSAVVFNYSPKKYNELFSYIRRVRVQHLMTHKYNGYSTSSYSILKNIRCVIQALSKNEIKKIGFILLVSTIIPAFLIGRLDVLFNRTHHNWKRSESTRNFPKA